MPRDVGKKVLRDLPVEVTGFVKTVDVDPGVEWDQKVFTWTAGKPTQILYKKATVTVAIKTLTWSGDEVTDISLTYPV